jgi:hypothetical protein
MFSYWATFNSCSVFKGTEGDGDHSLQRKFTKFFANQMAKSCYCFEFNNFNVFPQNDKLVEN